MTVGSGHEPAGDAMAAGRCAIGGSCAMERCAIGRELCHWERAVLVGDLPWRDAMGRFKKTGPKNCTKANFHHQSFGAAARLS